MKTKNYLLLLIISLSVFGLMSVQTKSEVAQTTVLEDILARGYLIVGSDNDYAPFESINVTSGFPEGFDIMIGHQIALDLGVGLYWKTAAWPPFDELNLKSFDITLNGITITAAREAIVDFSRWYYKSEQAMLVPTGNPLSITTEADLNVTGLRIGLQQGTTSHIYTQDQNLTATVTTYAQFSLALEALKLGALDVVLGDLAVLALDAAQSGLTEVVATFSPEDFGIAVAAGETELVAEIDKTLTSLLGPDPLNPQPTALYNAMYYHWFDSPDPYFVSNPDFTEASIVSYRAPLYDSGGNLVSSPPGNETITVPFGVPVIPPVTTTVAVGTLTNTATVTSNVTSTKTEQVPGFELLAFLLAIAVVPILRKYKK
ncbi:MAG: Cystine-binding periplasmic protein precursor [Candidatus Heimdallarchaeota archaeon LC_3]|nr:MAG: Cystine-binding periplasmic protein precursor [Candidatus Heimdallarchaeota archaeon LC_3]